MDTIQTTDIDRKRAIVDASSAIILFKAGLFGRLVQTYHVLMTTTVLSEVTRSGYPGAEFFREVARQPAVTIVPYGRCAAMRLSEDQRLFLLDRGERDTIFCLKHGRADFIIIDDGRGSSFCRNNDLPFINALLFPRVLLLSGRLSAAACDDKTARIIQCGRYSPKIIAAAGSMGLRELRPFLPGAGEGQ
jgi:hypothetical protein